MRKSHATMIQTLKLLSPEKCPFVNNILVHIRGKDQRFTTRLVSQDGDLLTLINLDDGIYVEVLLDDILTVELSVNEKAAAAAKINPPTPHQLRNYMSK